MFSPMLPKDGRTVSVHREGFEKDPALTADDVDFCIPTGFAAGKNARNVRGSCPQIRLLNSLLPHHEC
jgi:hypothetical protein